VRIERFFPAVIVGDLVANKDMHHEALQKIILLIQDTKLPAEWELPNAPLRVMWAFDKSGWDK
jgi:hypothetical protein